MRLVILLAFLAACPLLGRAGDPELNVNSRYLVESVEVSGNWGAKLSQGLRREINGLIGQHLDYELLDRLADRIRRQLQVAKVSVVASRGNEPDRVKITFAVEGGGQRKRFDIDVPKLAYHSRQGWSSEADAVIAFGQTDVSFGVVSDGDTLVGRFAGIRARVQRNAVATDRVKLGFEFDSFHDQWNPATLEAASRVPDAPPLFHSRNSFQPAATFVLAEGVTLSIGATFNLIDPLITAAPTESANAVVNSLRLHRRWEDAASNQHELDAGYSLRAATTILGSDYVYARHAMNARYVFRRNHNTLDIAFLAGRITGRAPIFERFVLGNAQTLRGWNKFDLDPLGADRVIHGSVEYRYRVFDVFYDSGAIWDANTEREGKHSMGFGVRTDGRQGFLLAIAFPLNGLRADPVFIAGFSF
jgi:hypothetical protein